jgi:hypothetical protein
MNGKVMEKEASSRNNTNNNTICVIIRNFVYLFLVSLFFFLFAACWFPSERAWKATTVSGEEKFPRALLEGGKGGWCACRCSPAQLFWEYMLGKDTGERGG